MAQLGTDCIRGKCLVPDLICNICLPQVHERSVQSDFLLIILKRLLTLRQDLKVILMSATIDTDRFSAYFQHCPVINIPGRTFPVQVGLVKNTVQCAHHSEPLCGLLTLRQDLKVILMNTTIDTKRFFTYFQHCPVINIPGRTFPVQVGILYKSSVKLKGTLGL